MTIKYENLIPEDKVFGKLLADPKVLRTNKVDLEWFTLPEYRRVAKIVIANGGSEMQADEILRRLNAADSSAEINSYFINSRIMNGDISDEEFKKNLNVLEYNYKNKWFEVAAQDLNRAIEINMPQDYVDRKRDTLDDRLRELKQVGQFVEDGTLGRIAAEVEYQLENDIEDGLKSYENMNMMFGGGIQKGEFMLVGARPAVGKTAFAINLILEYLDKNPDMNIDLYSLEMTQLQMIKRFLANRAEINSYNLRNPNRKLNDTEKQTTKKVLAALNDGRLRLFDKLTKIDDITRMITRRAYDCEDKNYIAFIDYIGLVGSSEGKTDQREVVDESSRKLKQLTIQLNVPVVALAQLNRGLEARQDKRPTLADLRDSGSLEQDANIVMFLWNPEEDLDNSFNSERIVEAVISKSREGVTGEIRFRFLKTKMIFLEVEH